MTAQARPPEPPQPPPLSYTPLALADRGRIDALALQVAHDGAVHLLASSHSEAGPVAIRLYALQGGAPAELGTFAPPQLYPPQWAAAVLPGPSLSVALNRPGGAASPLMHWRSDTKAGAAMSRADTFRVFRAPRLVRHAAGAPSFVAIEARPQSDIVTLFTADGSGWTERVLLEEPSVHGAVLASVRDGWLLLYKTAVSGGQVDEATLTRELPFGGQVSLGVVHGLPLRPDFSAAGSVFAVPMGPLYEFDADVLDDRLAVAGTAPDAYRVLDARLVRGALAVTSQQATPAAAAGAPSVLLHGGSLHVAVVEAIGTAEAIVSYGRRQ